MLPGRFALISVCLPSDEELDGHRSRYFDIKPYDRVQTNIELAHLPKHGCRAGLIWLVTI